MGDLIPLDTKKKIRTDSGFDFLNKISGFSLNQNSLITLLPILFIFLTTQNGAGFNINNIFNDKGFGSVFSKFKFSSENISRSLKTLNSIKPHASNNSLIGTISLALEAMYAFTTFQELTSNLSFFSDSSVSNAMDKIEKTQKFDSKEVNFKILEALSELLHDDMKPTIKQGMEMLRTMTLLQDVNTVMGKGKRNSGSFDISSLISILGPLLGQQSSLAGLGNMGDIKKMMDLFSAFTNNNSKSASKTTKAANKKKFNKEKAIDIEDYDEEDDDIIDELLDDLMDD